MGRTFVRQDIQIRKSDLYDDQKAAGSTMESAPTQIEEDLNNLRSQVNRLLHTTIAGNNWYDTPTRGLDDIETDLSDLENKPLICGVHVHTDVTVPNGQNWVVLSQASSETPTTGAAIGAGLGTVVGILAADVGAHDLTEISGTHALRPKNLCVIRDATSKDSITSGGMEVYALIQAETGTAQGEAFNDTDKQCQLSFVRDNGSDDLEAVPVADIQDKVVEYMHPLRVTLDTMPEDCGFPNVRFVDRVSAVNITLDEAIDNQGTTPATQEQNITINQAADLSWCWSDTTSTNFFCLVEGAGDSTTTVSVGAATDFFDVDAVDNDFLNGLKIDSGGEQINIGQTDGVIESTGSNDLRVLGAGELYLDDGNQTGSTWAQTDGIKLSDTTAEWDNYESIFGGEVSLLNAIAQAAGRVRPKIYATCTVTTTQDNDVGGVGGGTNLDAQLPDMSGGSFLTDYDVYINGELIRPAAVLNTNDYYPGTSLANGQLKLDFTISVGDVLCVIPHA